MHSFNSKTSVLICDDHPIFRQGLIRIIEREENLEIAGECGDGDSALEMINTLNPAITILDITMPVISGLNVAQVIKNQGISTKIIMITMHNDEEYLNEAIDIGVDGYLLKENASTDLGICIKNVIAGKHYVSPLLEDALRKYSKKIISENTYLSDLDKLSDFEKKNTKIDCI